MNKFALLFLAASGVSIAATDPNPFPFDHSQLSGWWGESYNTDPACGPENLKSTMEVSSDGKRLQVRFDRRWKTELGEMEGISADIVSATARTLVIRYENETRKKSSGVPVEWELVIVAPGVYRWRETEWKQNAVNTVVGIRCSP